MWKQWGHAAFNQIMKVVVVKKLAQLQESEAAGRSVESCFLPLKDLCGSFKMLSGCLYHRLNSLLPPLKPKGSSQMACMSEEDPGNKTKVGDQDFLRLEFLSACKILHDADTAMRFLPVIPHQFFPPLFQAILQKIFYSNMNLCERKKATAPLLCALAINWPYKTMVLRDLVPPLPSPTSKPQMMTFKTVEVMLDQFFDVLFPIPETFIRSKSVKVLEIKGPLCTLDITGFNLPASDVHLLERFVKMAYDPNSPPHYDRGEIILDTKIDGEAEDQFHALSVVCNLSRHHGAGLVIKFHKVHITAGPSKYIVPVLELLATNGTKFLELEMCGLYDEVLSSLLCMSESLSGLSLAYNPGITSVQFLTQLPHLSQLNLSGVNLRGRCEPLAGLSQGLQYLKLVGCRLRAAELEVLTTSRHVLSLYQLDLSENSFGIVEDFYSFCKLCKSLKRTSVLEAENCKLNAVNSELLVALLHIFVNMPNLSLLKITRNDFSSWTVKYHLPILGSSNTLCCLCLTVPSDVYLSDDYIVIDREINELRSNFTSSLLAANASHLAVSWDEECTYSHWFYSV